MNTQVATKQEFSLLPTTFAEAEKYAAMIARSSFCPQGFKNNPGDVLIAVQMGRELGLQPIQALQNIAVINGKPSIYGDAMLALVQQHPAYEWIKEESNDKEAVCTIKRKGEPEHTVKFTVDDAKRANLLEKPGPWKTYPKRMMQMRARGFACRDKFSDALKGFISAEEADDYPPLKSVKKEKYMGTIEPVRPSAEHYRDLYSSKFEDAKEFIQKANSIEELNGITSLVTDLSDSEKDEIRAIYANKKELLKNIKEDELKQEFFPEDDLNQDIPQ